MPCVVRKVPISRNSSSKTFEPYTAADLAEAARYEPDDGVYAAFATWNGLRVPKLSSHFDRLEDSARRAGFSLSLDRDLLRSQLRAIIEESGLGEVRIRLTAAPGDDSITVSIETYDGPPVDARRTGIVCRTVAHSARSLPEAKRTRWLTARPNGSGDGIYEYLLLDSAGYILEGSRSNFFAVKEAPTRPRVCTAARDVLAGIARSIVLEVVPPVAELLMEPARVDEIASLSEAFITASSRGIVPVVRIDDISVGTGKPGVVTKELTRRYDLRAADAEEPL